MMMRERERERERGGVHTIGSCFARVFLSKFGRRRLRSFVWPLSAVHLTAGLDEVRMPGPNQRIELSRPDTTSGCPGSGPVDHHHPLLPLHFVATPLRAACPSFVQIAGAAL